MIQSISRGRLRWSVRKLTRRSPAAGYAGLGCHAPPPYVLRSAPRFDSGHTGIGPPPPNWHPRHMNSVWILWPPSSLRSLAMANHSQKYTYISFLHKGPKCVPASTNRRALSLHKFLAKTCNNLALRVSKLAVRRTTFMCYADCRRPRRRLNLLKSLSEFRQPGLKQELPAVGALYWQTGYGVFSISPSHVLGIQKYIQNQEQTP